MATITGSQNERVFTIKKWLGLHEAPDGDTKLKLGEAANMRNWRVTRDGNLQKRPGSRCVWTGPSGLLSNMWSGVLGGKQYVLTVVANKVYSIYDDTTGTWATTNTPLGTISGFFSNMFEFQGKVYIIAAGSMYSYDGTTFSTVAPYIPIVVTGQNYLGQGSTLEQINKLTVKRRFWITGDGSSDAAHRKIVLPEEATSIVSIINRSTEAALVSGTDYTEGIDPNTNKIKNILFLNAIPDAINIYEVVYSVNSTDGIPSEIANCKKSVLYNGDQNNRIFLYGNSTNKAFYSGIDYNGTPRADYFPDLNEVAVGDSEEQINSMIRYNSRLICFKSNSVFSINYGQQTLADGSVIAAFCVTPVHSELGGDFAQMVMNSPVVIFDGDAYSWVGNDYGNMSADERQAKRISDRIHKTLASMSVTFCYDDNYNQEYYICDYVNKTTLVWNYAIDAWYLYTGIGIGFPFAMNGRLYYLTRGDDVNASVQMLDPAYPCDKISTADGAAIDCYWEGASEGFGAEYQRKYSAMLWIGMKPEAFSRVWVTVATDRSGSYNTKLVETNYFSFPTLNFSRFTFNPVKNPRMTRLKIKAKKFAFYKLILKTNTDDSTATVTAADFRIRFTGYVK